MMLLTLLCYSPCHLSVVVISCYFQTPFWKKSTSFHGDVQMLIGTSNNSKCEIKEERIRNRWVKSDFSAYWCRCQYMCMSNFSLLADSCSVQWWKQKQNWSLCCCCYMPNMSHWCSIKWAVTSVLTRPMEQCIISYVWNPWVTQLWGLFWLEIRLWNFECK